jgi:hypothetical protein
VGFSRELVLGKQRRKDNVELLSLGVDGGD